MRIGRQLILLLAPLLVFGLLGSDASAQGSTSSSGKATAKAATAGEFPVGSKLGPCISRDEPTGNCSLTAHRR